MKRTKIEDDEEKTSWCSSALARGPPGALRGTRSLIHLHDSRPSACSVVVFQSQKYEMSWMFCTESPVELRCSSKLPALITAVRVEPPVDRTGQNQPPGVCFIYCILVWKNSDIPPSGPMKLRQPPTSPFFFCLLTSVVLQTSYFQTRKQTAREEQDVLHSPGVWAQGGEEEEEGWRRWWGMRESMRVGRKKPPPTVVKTKKRKTEKKSGEKEDSRRRGAAQ